MKTIIWVVIAFVAALAVSIGIRLYVDPDFTGFGGDAPPSPVVTHLGGEDSPSVKKSGDAASYDWKDHPVFVVGDSLTQGARSAIESAIGGGTIDGKQNRNMSDGLSIIQRWDDTGALTDEAIIVVCLAHNITDGTLRDAEKIVGMIRPGQSLIMMTGHGRSNMMPINEYIRSLPRAYSYITAADWDLTVSQSPNLLSDDGIHVAKKQGNDLYASLIVSALEVAQPMP